MYTIYTDGGCSGNPGPGGWGFVLLKDSVLIVEKSGGEKFTTNNKMELTAVIEALTFLKENGIKTKVKKMNQKNIVLGLQHLWERQKEKVIV